MKILISYPPMKGKGIPTLGQNRQFQWFTVPSFIYPMVPSYAASHLQAKGYDVVYRDSIAMMEKEEDYYKFLEDNKFDLILFETKAPVVKLHWEIIGKIKDKFPDIKIVLVGDHITHDPIESFNNSKVDYTIKGGYYDFGIVELADYLSGKGEMPKGIHYRNNDKIEFTGEPGEEFDLDSLPFIDRELTQWKLYGEKIFKRYPNTYTYVGRDCPYGKCAFCAWTTLYKKYRTRSPKSLLDEIEMLVEKYGIREVFDDSGSFPVGKWLDEFCHGMIDRGLNKKVTMIGNFRFEYVTEERAKLLRKAGFRLFKLGLESANQDTLDRINKKLTVKQIVDGCKTFKKAGIDVHLTIMIGYPWETVEDMDRTFELAKWLMKKGYAALLQSTVVVPYPGTPLYEDAVKNDWLRYDPKDYEKFDMRGSVFKFTPEVEKAVVDYCNRIYKLAFHPSFFMRQVLRVRTWEDIKFLFKAAKSVVGHLFDFKSEKKKKQAQA